ncbi:uncharacterized protein LOC116433801 isoform X2 [Nomia melanderi]|nr:NK-tumor recognition protein isoform X2 [Nomia melanderi]XP_031848170.1 NK-tumor recognition protein isoform X2 [Nomia melanderi]XP_031848171.1 NK-tumor recognition protein isoform X2 [Nomia melanderi]
MEKPQDLLMHMVENDFDYMETHLDIANSDSLWSNEHERAEDMGEMSIAEIPTISKIDNIKEDFAKVLTDWQEHIGYLQATDIDEYMDIIGLNMNTTDRKSFCISENVFQDEQLIQTLESDGCKTKQADFKRERLQTSKNVQEPSSSNKVAENSVEQISYRTIADASKSCDKHIDIELKQGYLYSKHSHNKVKENIPKYDSTGIDITANMLAKQKKRKKEKSILSNKDTKSSNHNDKFRSNQLPVLEAGTVESLLEQFEASEKNVVSSDSSSKNNIDLNQDLNVSCNKKQQFLKESGIGIPKKSLSHVSNVHKNVRNVISKEVIEKIKTSGRKKVISIIPTMASIQGTGRSNGTRMQDAAATLSRNKLLKIVTNNTKNRAIDGGLVQLDHDYCSSTNSSISSSDSNSEYDKQFSDSEKSTPIKSSNRQQAECHTTYTEQTISLHGNEIVIKEKGYSIESSTQKDNMLELHETDGNYEEQTRATVFKAVQIDGSIKVRNETECQKETVREQENCQYINRSNNTTNGVSQLRNESTNNSTPEMKIRSALATSILQLQRGALTKTKSLNGGNQKTKQMVSVLKKPLNVQQLPTVVITGSYENVVTTNDSSNNKVQNIIIQNAEENLTQDEEKKPPRKKLNLAEYRSRREQNRSDNSRTNSPIQPMTLIYIHHASTTTEPVKDDFGNLNWTEREIVSILKPKVDIDEEKVRPKPDTCDMGIQTYETVFEFPPKSLIDVDERPEEDREKHILNTSQRSYRKHRISSSSSRSRSRSKSKSRSKSRSRSSSSRSRSRKRSNTRHRRISHRRSSVSSSSSWSSRSRSRSNTRSTFSSESTYSRSRSRSSRSRSRCSSRYSSCSRSSSRSNFGRSKWSSRRRKERHYRKSYDRHRQHSSSSYRSYRDWRRSPSSSYHKAYDAWYDREKQRQVEERRVIYVGRLEEGITKADLRKRFEAFGPVVDISVHFREHGDNYGFVTFAYKNDAYEAVEHGNDDPTLPRYDLCFGGRRAFCKVKYADLDGMASNSPNSGYMSQMNEDNTFDLLLKEAKAKLRKRKV